MSFSSWFFLRFDEEVAEDLYSPVGSRPRLSHISKYLDIHNY